MRFFLKKISYSKPRYCSFRIKNNGIAPTAAVVNIVPRVDTSYNILYCILRVWVIKKLKAIQKMLLQVVVEAKFVRIHKSYMVSVANITAVRKNSVFIGKMELPVGETYKDAVRQIIGREL